MVDDTPFDILDLDVFAAITGLSSAKTPVATHVRKGPNRKLRPRRPSRQLKAEPGQPAARTRAHVRRWSAPFQVFEPSKTAPTEAGVKLKRVRRSQVQSNTSIVDFNDLSQCDFRLEIPLYEDIASELSVFVRLVRLGLFHEAGRYYERCLEYDSRECFPVVVEYAEFLLEQGQYRDLSSFLDDVSLDKFPYPEYQFWSLLKALCDSHFRGRIQEALSTADLWGQRSLFTASENLSATTIKSLLVYLRICVSFGSAEKRNHSTDFDSVNVAAWSAFVDIGLNFARIGHSWEASQIFRILLPVLSPLEASSFYDSLFNTGETSKARELDVVAHLNAVNSYARHLLRDGPQHVTDSSVVRAQKLCMTSEALLETLFVHYSTGYPGRHSLQSRLASLELEHAEGNGNEFLTEEYRSLSRDAVEDELIQAECWRARSALAFVGRRVPDLIDSLNALVFATSSLGDFLAYQETEMSSLIFAYHLDTSAGHERKVLLSFSLRLKHGGFPSQWLYKFPDARLFTYYGLAITALTQSGSLKNLSADGNLAQALDLFLQMVVSHNTKLVRRPRSASDLKNLAEDSQRQATTRQRRSSWTDKYQAKPQPTLPKTEDEVTLQISRSLEQGSGITSVRAHAESPSLSDTTAMATPYDHDDIHRIKDSILNYAELEEMGSGAYAQVKLVRRKVDDKKFVMKYITKNRILVDTWIRDRIFGTIPLEIHVLAYLRRSELRHPNIVEMTGFFEDDVNYYLAMKPHGLPWMDLFDYIELRTDMTEVETRSIFQQVVSAIHHLHTKALVTHRDIKDENIILDGEGRLQIIDFGSAAYIKNGPFDVFVGTIDYAAPEVLQGKLYQGPQQDIWAMGILLYTIVFKENPFYNLDEILDHPLRVEGFPFGDECLDLIRAMLDRDVSTRWTAAQVMNHPWLEQVSDIVPPQL